MAKSSKSRRFRIRYIFIGILSTLILIASIELFRQSIIANAGDEMHLLESRLKSMDAVDRSTILSVARNWSALAIRPGEVVLLLVILGTTVLLLWQNQKPKPNYRFPLPEHDIGRGRRVTGADNIVELMYQDTAPVAYDVHFGKFSAHEYRGAIHWWRDVTEKVLSVVLIIAFDYYVAKAIGYFWDYATGDAWRLVLVPLDISVALALTGWFLIIDGLIQVAAMFDAPGVSRTLDSLIVVVAGFIVMLVEARPSEEYVVSFTFAQPYWLVPALSGIIALFFVVRIGTAYWLAKIDKLR